MHMQCGSRVNLDIHILKCPDECATAHPFAKRKRALLYRESALVLSVVADCVVVGSPPVGREQAVACTKSAALGL